MINYVDAFVKYYGIMTSVTGAFVAFVTWIVSYQHTRAITSALNIMKWNSSKLASTLHCKQSINRLVAKCNEYYISHSISTPKKQTQKQWNSGRASKNLALAFWSSAFSWMWVFECARHKSWTKHHQLQTANTIRPHQNGCISDNLRIRALPSGRINYG